mgnify:CR=1 FL=1
MTQWIGAITRGHNGGAVLLKDGEIVFAIEEERFVRLKHYAGFPSHFIDFCLSSSNIKVSDLDFITVFSTT